MKQRGGKVEQAVPLEILVEREGLRSEALHNQLEDLYESVWQLTSDSEDAGLEQLEKRGNRLQRRIRRGQRIIERAIAGWRDKAFTEEEVGAWQQFNNKINDHLLNIEADYERLREEFNDEHQPLLNL